MNRLNHVLSILMMTLLVMCTGCSGDDSDPQATDTPRKDRPTIKPKEPSPSGPTLPQIDRIVLRYRSPDLGKPVAITDQTMIRDIYNCVPFASPTPLGTTFDFNSLSALEFSNQGRRLATVHVRQTETVYDIEGNSNGPFTVVGDLGKLLDAARASSQTP